LQKAHEVSELLRFLDIDFVEFPDFRAAYLDDLRSFKEELFDLFVSLRAFYNNDIVGVIPFHTLLHSLPTAKLFDDFKIEFASTLAIEPLKEKLLHWGYTFVDIVQQSGEVSFRGDIIDIFPNSETTPFRISLFDDEVEEIRIFDLDSQKSHKEEIEAITVTPAFFAFDATMYQRVKMEVEHNSDDALFKDIATHGFWHLGEALSQPLLQTNKALLSEDLSETIDEAYRFDTNLIDREFFNIDILPPAQKTLPVISSDYEQTIKAHSSKKITLIALNSAVVKQAGIYVTDHLNIVYAPHIINLVSHDELILSLNKEGKKKRRKKARILLDELKPGDYVVHEEHGVALFEKVEVLEVLGAVKEFLSLRYQGEDRLLIPAENLEVIDRYIADSGALATIDKLGKGSFAKLKDKVRKKLFEIAGQIVNTAAERTLLKAPLIKVPRSELLHFQSLAGFEYTYDQAKAIEKILEGLRGGEVLDHLLSGDVGFGKTEVAMNAIFAAAKSGYQSAFIVPTTLLSTQHFVSVTERLKEFGIRIARMDRFVTNKTNVKKMIANGEVDVVIGTHALFGLTFKNLGLAIVDEEHKFGVKQKEKLKELVDHVHILSMSATPIPRSLNMALSHIKTLSELHTPPSERKGVRTFVKNYDEALIKEVILRELRRGGQLFYVFNSIVHMEAKKEELLEILPTLRVTTLHSKISAAQTEKELDRFQRGELDMLLSTSIIESGIHMPTVNTILIDGADRFGIADLHQLRGRVGRSNIEGFCYFLVDDKERLTKEATKRLVALESNSYLGSGSSLAYHDLEIRGGGNLVGDAQSGHIKQIGYSLYLRMLEEAINTLTNQPTKRPENVDMKLSVTAYLSQEVINEDRLRIELYRRLSRCESVSEIYEVEEEVIDRFGDLDTPTKQFFEVMVIKLLSREHQIKAVSNYGQNVTLIYQNDEKRHLKAHSKDDDDVIAETLKFLRVK
jgi:transcription-repair coupling factor (superfamily II helicase)